MTRKALLVIDMLNDFVHPDGVLYCGQPARDIVPSIRKLVDQFASQGDLVVFVKDAHRPDDPEFQMFPPHAVKNSWGSEIVPELAPPEGALQLEKTRYDAFFGTDLDAILKRTQPREVWVTGVCTSICVMDTVGQLRNRDLPVFIPTHAVADFDADFHAFALKRMERIYGATLVTD